MNSQSRSSGEAGITGPKIIVPHHGRVTRQQREAKLKQRAVTIWMTGLSGAGKSTLAYEIDFRLHRCGYISTVLDGDNLRLGLNKDLGFSPRERAENIRRAAEVAAAMNEAGLIVLASLISPLQTDRVVARSVIGEESFLEMHICASLEVCEMRDPKGLYQKARNGVIPYFTGVSAPYEPPLNPSLRLDNQSPREVFVLTNISSHDYG